MESESFSSVCKVGICKIGGLFSLGMENHMKCEELFLQDMPGVHIFLHWKATTWYYYILHWKSLLYQIL